LWLNDGLKVSYYTLILTFQFQLYLHLLQLPTFTMVISLQRFYFLS